MDVTAVNLDKSEKIGVVLDGVARREENHHFLRHIPLQKRI